MKEGWTYKKLGEVCEIYNGNSINTDYKKKHFLGASRGIPFIATKDVTNNGTLDYNNGVRIPNFNDYKIAPADSVFICAEGGSAGKKYAYVEKDVCFGNKLFCIHSKSKNLEGKYIFFYIQSDKFKEQFYSLLSGLIGGVSSKKFQTIVIPIPALSDQQRIVSRLDSAFAYIDELKANAEKQISEARALFQKALAKAMEPKVGWEEKTLSSVVHKDCNLSYGIVQPGDHIEGGVPVVRPVDFNNKVIVGIEGLKRTNKEISDAYKRTILKGGELLFCVRGTTGTMGLASEELKGCNVTRGIVPIYFPDDINLMFVYYEMLSPRLQEVIQQITTGTALKQVNIKDLRNLHLALPPLSEQRRIVARLDSLSENVRKFEEIQKKIIAECDTLKQALLRQVFE